MTSPAHIKPIMLRFLLLSVLLVAAVARPAAPSCSLCILLADQLAPYIRTHVNQTLNIIDPIADAICDALAAEGKVPDCSGPGCKVLCAGLVKENGPEIINIALNTVLTGVDICAALGQCARPPPPPEPCAPGQVPVRTDISNRSGERVWPSWSLKTGRGYFVHLSDVHVDLHYQPNTNTNCGEPICCHASDGVGTSGYWGDYNCDAPPQLVNSLFSYIAAMQPTPPDFIIYTGDSPAHDIWNQSQAANLAAFDFVFNAFAQHLPDVPIFPAIGNHLFFPVNQDSDQPGANDVVFKHVAKSWSRFLPDIAIPTLEYGGYYTARVRPGLRVIALNTNVYSPEDFYLFENHTDFTCQFNWMEDVLQQAAMAGERCILIGHHPAQSMYDDFAFRFNAIIEKYQFLIIGHYVGHTHNNALSVQFDNMTGTVPIHVTYKAGSLTTFSNLNPGFRVASYDRLLATPKLMTDFSDHWLDLNATNAAGPSHNPKWFVI
jgi:hypothetical protein